ncbi:MAG TPA: OB-fold nucleic acid binding domain-containing protein, partial [Gemmatimonadaceae bacterium]|nr:OB-fold nucleic acid binding domain-containing protein [Gemmatimonadaceae bacterium]
MTFPQVGIAELPSHVGRAVTVRGWVTHLRSSGKVAFVVLRDGSGIVQAVLVKNAVPADSWERFGQLTLETSVVVTGEPRLDARAPGGVELSLSGVEIIGPSPLDYPIQPKEHGIDFLLDVEQEVDPVL